MVRLLKWTVVAGALAAVVAFVPLGGRTLLERWRSSRGAGDFAARLGGEVEREARRLLRGSAAGSTREAQARAAPRPPKARPGQAPAEHHTDADRKAVDAIVAEHAR